MCANAVVGSARRWMLMSPMTSIVIACDPEMTLHFHAASAARTVAIDKVTASRTADSLFIAFLQQCRLAYAYPSARGLGQRKCVDHVARRDRDELTSVDRVAHRRRGEVSASLHMPQVSAGFRVERDEIAVADRTEHDVAGGGQDAVGQRALEDLDVPHRLAGLGIDGLDAGGW